MNSRRRELEHWFFGGTRRAAVRRGLVGLVCLVVLGSSGTARSDIVLHEYIPPDPAEDLRLGATTSDGAMAAAIQTETGPVASPDANAPAKDNGAVYGRDQETGADSYRVDRDTSRPSSVRYSDPFTPAIAPYKREFAYDTVNAETDLRVRDPALMRLAVGGAARAEDDQFYADLEVDLRANEPVRVPSVGPAAHIFAARATPEAVLTFFHDSADNWFVKGDHDGRIRLVMHLGIDRGVFGSAFADVDWARLSRFVPPIPDHVKTEGIRVAREIGIVDGTGPAEALRSLVKYFREFAPSTDHPKSAGLDLYRELTLSQKGVCRHRSFAFVVTALALGLPARFVHNEAHAWVEVFDATRWHRVDLGGAADELDFSDENRVAHVPPRDPFEWPKSKDSGEAMATRGRTTAQSNGSASGATGRSGASSGTSPSPEPEPGPDPDDRRAASTVTLDFNGAEARRGGRVKLSGTVRAASNACAEMRIDLVLVRGENNGTIPLGALVTDNDGRYAGQITVPYTVPPGDYSVRATTPGNLACGRGESL
ncbi:MAG TPA: transglutaminase domain-containing protein [Polyangiaceae bacterium]|jgi:transglutaminase-like putative cysteine protease|nr:transglutaminase domain-containing protein [Polyangiaceae bacterium]